MREKIQQLEKVSALLEPTEALRQSWNRQVWAYSENFLQGMEERKTFEAFTENGRALLDHPIREEGRGMEELLKLMAENVDTPGLNPASGGHLAYIPGGGIYPTALGDFLAAVTNRYAGIFFASPGAVRMENQLIRWMCRLVGYPETALGNLTSGGSIANLTAIATARDAKGISAGKIFQSPIYLTHQAHHSVQKAIRIAGLNEAPLRYIPVDEHFRMDISALRAQLATDRAAGLQPFLLVGSAGTTDTGAIDPLQEMSELAQQYHMWYC